MDELLALTARMMHEGIRRLWIISGENDWCRQQAEDVRAVLAGDGLWVGPREMPAPYCSPDALARLLGREYRHAIFDARCGFDVAAFAALGGTLQAGSWLILLLPPLARWAQTPDDDAVRWCDTVQPVPAPHFAYHFRGVIDRHPQTLVWQQGESLQIPDYPAHTHWLPAMGEPQAEQAAILEALAALPPGVAIVTAGRGRGKSAMAGMHMRRMQGDAIVTAPSRGATDVIAAFAADKFRFMAPDALLASGESADWLIVDEAAAIPAPLLRTLVARFPRALLTTTVQGYEGTGRGFLLKLCARFPQRWQFSLNQPIRWAQGCPLESFISDALLFDDDSFACAPGGDLHYGLVEQTCWQIQPELPHAIYRLLCGAHYRTSPLDLRRMMDAPGQHFISANSENGLAGAVWLVDEGGLSAELSQAIWAGYRRPRGNLVAQSLAAHGGSALAATLTGLRVSRIAVHPDCQREGIGQALIEHALAVASGADYLSVSFGYTPELWRFWQRCGFILVRIGTHREASSGCYTAMALHPLTAEGQQLAAHEHRRLCRDWHWLSGWLDEQLPLPEDTQTPLSDDDWWELAGFAFAHRPLMAALGSLNRLVRHVSLPLPALRGRLRQQSEAVLCCALQISGRKALLVRLRTEAAHALNALDENRRRSLQMQVQQLPFLH